MTREEVHKTLIKFGYYSTKREPYVYDGVLGVGVSYSFKDPVYGSLSRIFIPNDNNDLEDFLNKYYFYKKYNSKYHLNLILDDYKIPNPRINLSLNEETNFIEIKRQINMFKNNIDNSDEYLKKIKRTLNLLCLIVLTKLHNQVDTYNNLVTITNKYYDKSIKLNDLKNKYYKTNNKIFFTDLVSLEMNFDEEFSKLKAAIRDANDREAIELDIGMLVNYLKDLELDSDYLNNKYELIKMPLEIEEINKEIDFVNNELSSKIPFKKRRNIDMELLEIKRRSNINKIVSFDTFYLNEEKRIHDKYEIIPDLDVRTIADYFIEFDNLKINDRDEVDIANKRELSYLDELEDKENKYNHLDKEDRDLLVEYRFVSKYILNNNPSSKDLDNLREIINSSNNVMFRLKYLKDLNLHSNDELLESVRVIEHRLKDLNIDILNIKMNMFFKGPKVLKDERYLLLSSKVSHAPSYKYSTDLITYIASVNKNSVTYFLNEEVRRDFINDENLIFEDKTPMFILDMNQNEIKEDNSDIIRVVHYETVTTKDKDVTIVSDVKRSKIESYKKISIGRQGR